MAHAAPVTGRRTVPARSRGPAQSGSSAPRRRDLRLTPPAWTAVGLPLLAGLVYGVWTSGVARNEESGLTWGNAMFGVAWGAAFALVCMVLHIAGRAMPREIRAASWAAFAGASFGYLHSLSGTHSTLFSAVLSLAIATGVFVAALYRYHTTE